MCTASWYRCFKISTIRHSCTFARWHLLPKLLAPTPLCSHATGYWEGGWPRSRVVANTHKQGWCDRSLDYIGFCHVQTVSPLLPKHIGFWELLVKLSFPGCPPEGYFSSDLQYNYWRKEENRLCKKGWYKDHEHICYGVHKKDWIAKGKWFRVHSKWWMTRASHYCHQVDP